MASHQHNHTKLMTLLLKCADHLCMKQVLQVQARLITHPPPSLHPNLIAVKLIGIYAAHANLRHAALIFSQLPNPNVFAWNAIIKAHVHNGSWVHALNRFNLLVSSPRAPNPNEHIFTSVLKACAGLEATIDGAKLHAVVTKAGFDSNVFVRSSLVDMYFKFRNPVIARQLFDEMPVKDVVSWNTLVSGYCLCGDLGSAKRVFDGMVEKSPASWSALITGYAQSGHLDAAGWVFNEMPGRNVVSWNAMIGGYVENEKYNDAIDLFYEMRRAHGVVPNDVTLVSVLSACAHVGALDLGKWIEQFISGSGRELSLFLGNALVDMYGKCGSIEEARRVFGDMQERDVISWSTIISGLAVHGHAEEAFGCYYKMLECEVKPNAVTFMGLLLACNHSGLVDKGLECFNLMIEEYGIAPKIGHYGCVVDLLSRAGHLDEAEDLINSMPMKANVIVWGALLGGCRIYKDFRRGECVLQHLLELDSEYTGSYVYIAGVNASVGRLDDAADCWLRMQDKGIMKNPGCSRIEVHNEVQEFEGG